jgi:carbonic anhydrase
MKTVEIIFRYGAQDASARHRPTDADAARLRLEQGNQAFASLLDGLADDDGATRRVIHVDAQDLGLNLGRKAGPRQRPYAAVLGCSDARVPVELIFNEGPNDLFVIRVAGNGLGNEVLGSLRYAVEHLGGSMKLVAVLGHSGCGAVSAAVDVFQDPARYLSVATSHSLRSIIDRLLVVVQACAKRMNEILGAGIVRSPGYRTALVEMSVILNAALAAHTVQRELRSADIDGIKVVYGVYLLETRQVWAPRRGTAAWTGLADPPVGPVAFVELGNAVINSDRITSLLKAD